MWQNVGKTKRWSTFENRHIGRLMIGCFTFSDAGYLSSNFPLFHFSTSFFSCKITIFWVVQCLPVDSMDSADSYISLNHRRTRKKKYFQCRCIFWWLSFLRYSVDWIMRYKECYNDKKKTTSLMFFILLTTTKIVDKFGKLTICNKTYIFVFDIVSKVC